MPRTRNSNKKKTNKVLLLGREHDVSAFAASEDSRYALSSIQVDPIEGDIIGTNGKFMISVPLGLQWGIEEYPKPDVDIGPIEKPILVSAKDLAKAFKTAPKKKRVPPILRDTVLVGMQGSDIILYSTDMDKTSSIQSKPIDKRFPPCRECIPDMKDGSITFRLNAKLLKTICDYAIMHGDEKQADGGQSIEFEIEPISKVYTKTQQKRAIKFDILLQDSRGHATGLIMPIAEG